MAEDKREGEMQLAVGDITGKLADMSAVHYGALPFIMAYTAAGSVVQFHSVFWNRTARQVRPKLLNCITPLHCQPTN